LINTHIFIRGWQAVPSGSAWRVWYAVGFWALALAYIAGRFLERTSPPWLSAPFVWVGSFWLAAMAYFYLAVLLIDLLRFINHLVPFFPAFLTRDVARTRLVTAGVLVGGVALAVLLGFINARFPRVKTIELTIPKRSAVPSMTIVSISDIHLGTIIGRSFFDRIVEKINAADADLVLLPGDIVDEDIAPVVRQDLGDSIRRIRSRHGVYGITGNHEYIGGVDAACKYISDHGVVMLRDSVATVEDAVVLVGREDLMADRFAGRKRLPLSNLMTNVDRSLPIILLDHQPHDLNEGAANGVDLQISGHTHHGQLWPFNYIAEAVYEVSWGYKKKGNTHVYVSSGLGTWGPPVRTGNCPEIMVFKLHFQPVQPE
jgi:predicted MPP superfamily phosphohydrolase